MVEIRPLILDYSHLEDLPRADDALHTLKMVASLVKPIMRAHNWKVHLLGEFYPDKAHLLGINVGKGHEIFLRLRLSTDNTVFLPMEEVIDTMLHELAHNVHDEHEVPFYALLNQLRQEHTALAAKGFTGEAFLSEGKQLGRPPGSGRESFLVTEARRLAKKATDRGWQRAGRRIAVLADRGERILGGGSKKDPPTEGGHAMRAAMASAAELRRKTLKGCGNTKEDVGKLARDAVRDRTKTRADGDGDQALTERGSRVRTKR